MSAVRPFIPIFITVVTAPKQKSREEHKFQNDESQTPLYHRESRATRKFILSLIVHGTR